MRPVSLFFAAFVQVECTCANSGGGFATFDCNKYAKAADARVLSPLCTTGTCAATNEPCLQEAGSTLQPCCNSTLDRCVAQNAQFAQCVASTTTLDALKAQGWDATVLLDCREHAQVHKCTAENGSDYSVGEDFASATVRLLLMCFCLGLAAADLLLAALDRVRLPL